MKIVYASKYYYRRGGLEAYLLKAKSLLEENGHSVIPFSTNYHENLPSDYSGYFPEYYDLSQISKTRVLENVRAFRNMFFNQEAYEAVSRLCQEEEPQLLQGFGITKHLSSSVLEAAKDQGVSTVLRLSDYALMCPNSTALDGRGNLCESFDCISTNNLRCLKTACVKDSKLASLIGLLEVRINKYLGSYLNAVDHWIAPSAFIQDVFVRHFGISPKKITHIPVFFDGRDHEQAKSPGNYVLYAGRLDREKGLKTLVECFGRMKKYNLKIAGSGPLELELRAQVHSLGMENVEFLGFQEMDKLMELIHEARCLVVPSEWFENSPNVVLEAYAHGRPVIGSKIGGIPELVLDQETGLCFDPGNSYDLQQKIEDIMRNPLRAAQLGRRGRELLSSKWNADSHYQNLMDTYQLAID